MDIEKGGAAMQQWEYKFIKADTVGVVHEIDFEKTKGRERPRLIPLIKDLGQEGWEAISSTPINEFGSIQQILLKRPH
jgi:hypothetical protein